MASGDTIADDQQVVRHCDSKWFFDGESISAGNFMLRPAEEYLSVGWLTRYAAGTEVEQIAAYRAKIHPAIRRFKTSDKLAVLEVGRTRDNVLRGTPDRRQLSFLHWPINAPLNDDGHSGIHNTENNTRVTEMLAESIAREYPARS